MAEVATPIPLAEWQAEMEKRGKLDCKFVCPVCRNAASPNDWRARLPDANPDRAAVECIGRIMPRDQTRAAPTGEPNASDPERPCDYAAFGLLDVCTVHVAMPDGQIIGVFEFAEAP